MWGYCVGVPAWGVGHRQCVRLMVSSLVVALLPAVCLSLCREDWCSQTQAHKAREAQPGNTGQPLGNHRATQQGRWPRAVKVVVSVGVGRSFLGVSVVIPVPAEMSPLLFVHNPGSTNGK